MIAALPMALTSSERVVWYVILGLAFVVVLVVVGLMFMLLGFIADIGKSVDGLLGAAGAVGTNTANIPELLALPPVLDAIAEEGVVQDGYMNALSQGYQVR